MGIGIDGEYEADCDEGAYDYHNEFCSGCGKQNYECVCENLLGKISNFFDKLLGG